MYLEIYPPYKMEETGEEIFTWKFKQLNVIIVVLHVYHVKNILPDPNVMVLQYLLLNWYELSLKMNLYHV